MSRGPQPGAGAWRAAAPPDARCRTGPSRSRRAATCAAPRCPRTTATCCTWTSGRSSARARRCWALRSGDAEFRPDGHARRVAGGARRCPTSSGRASGIPIGLAFFLRRADGAVVALYPSPAGATECGARPRRPGTRWSRLNPVLARLRARRRGADRDRMAEPPRRRSRRSTRRYRLVGLIKAAGRDLRRRRRRAAVDGFFAGAGGVAREPAEVERPLRRARVRGARAAAVPHGAAPTLAFRMRVREPAGRAGLHDRADRADPIEPARRAYDAATRERLLDAVRGARALGRPRARPALGAGASARAELHRRDDVRAQVPCTLRPRGRDHASTSTRCPTARSRCRSTSTARCSTAATTAGSRSTQVPWNVPAQFRMPVETWRDLIGDALPASARLDRR